MAVGVELLSPALFRDNGPLRSNAPHLTSSSQRISCENRSQTEGHLTSDQANLPLISI